MANDQKKSAQTAGTTTEVYHFSGSGEYVPMAVEAANIDEAQKFWEKNKISIIK